MEDSIIMLQDENGNMIEFEAIDCFEFEGKTYDKLTFDFEGLLGSDMIAVENEMAADSTSQSWNVNSIKSSLLAKALAKSRSRMLAVSLAIV